MKSLICGSLAFDTIMSFQSRFSEALLADQLHKINVCFFVPEMRREFGGCAGNIAYNLKLLGGDPLIMATIGQDGASSDNHSSGRVRVVTDSTHLELYAEVRGFTTTKPARIRQWDSSPRIDFTAIRWDATLQKYVALATVYQWFNLDSPTILAHCESTAMLTADTLTGTWTMDYTLSPPIPQTYYSGQRSVENPTWLNYSFGGAPPPFARGPRFFRRRF